MGKITVVPGDRLTPDHVRAWSDLQRADPVLDSPFFRPEFTQAVAAVRGDVRVGVLEEGGEPVGFFPFQTRGWNGGRPVGGPMSDYQGVIARPGAAWGPAAVVRGCGLASWDFDHLVAAQESFRPYHQAAADSPYLDLSAGFDAYAAARRKAGSTTVKDTLGKVRKIEREVGPVRLEVHATEPKVFSTLMEWKRAQYERTQTIDVLSFGWTVRLLESIVAQSGEAFSGLLSVLYVRDAIAAVHLGMRSHAVLHSWFPAYDVNLSRYSPGMVLLIELARALPGMGVGKLDLGKGAMEWKTNLMSGSVPLAEGCVTANPVVRMARSGWRRARTWLKASRLGAPARAFARLTLPVRGWMRFR